MKTWRLAVIIGGVVIALSGIVALSRRSTVTLNEPAASGGYDMSSVHGHNNVVPVVVIGSGPAGLAAALYSARGGNYTVVFEGIEPGGLLTKTSYIENWPSRKKILGQDLMEKFHEQVGEYPVTFMHESITGIDLKSWPFTVTTEEGVDVKALSLVMATGSTPLTLGIPGEKEYWGRGVTTCAICDAPFYDGKDVVVIGGGDSAVEEAIQLSAYAKNITVLVRKGEMRASQASQKNMRAIDSISVQYNKGVNKIIGDDDKVTHIEVYDSQAKTTKIEPIDGVFLAIGHKPNTDLVRSQVKTDDNGYIVLEGRSQRASVSGLFAAGDVADHHYKQAGKAAGDGIAAGIDANNFLSDLGFNIDVAKELSSVFYGFQKPLVGDDVLSVSTIEEFDALINDNDQPLPIVVEFIEGGCPECSSMEGIIKEVAPTLAGTIRFAFVDITKVPELVEQLIIIKTPTTLVYKNGQMLARYQNALSKSIFEEFIKQFVGA